MVYENPNRVEARIRRLTQELDEIDKFFYGPTKDDDRLLYMGMLERKRDDVVRSVVLQLHTSIEDLMTSMLFGWVLGTPHNKSQRKRRRTKRGQALDQLMKTLGFEAKLNFAVVVGVITPPIRDRLKEMNRIRNKCSHNWLLNVPVKPKKKAKGSRSRLLTYGGRDLHQAKVLEAFAAEYGRIYCRLFAKALV
jgi:hypothetical protein